jgi:hypothetical protein
MLATKSDNPRTDTEVISPEYKVSKAIQIMEEMDRRSRMAEKNGIGIATLSETNLNWTNKKKKKPQDMPDGQ